MKQLLVVLLLWPAMSWSAIPPQKQSQSTFERALQAPLKLLWPRSTKWDLKPTEN